MLPVHCVPHLKGLSQKPPDYPPDPQHKHAKVNPKQETRRNPVPLEHHKSAVALHVHCMNIWLHSPGREEVELLV